MKEYFIGLDVGTDSVGWAAVDTDYRVMKFRGNAMWGVELFDESNTAVERRGYRTSRRRYNRTRQRLDLLEMLFDKEIAKKDAAFFQKLRESNLYLEDKELKCPYTLFNDNDYTDAKYHEDYPTVYHLRNELLKSKEAHDVRLVFLALHHIIKNRGHFLFDGLSESEISSFSNVFNELCIFLKDEFAFDDEDEFELHCENYDALADILKNRKLGKTAKKKAITEYLGVSKKEKPQLFAMLSTLSGSKIKLSEIFADETLDDGDTKAVEFSGKYDDEVPNLQSTLGDRFELIERLKAIYDWAVLADILDGEKHISAAKVKAYDKHKSDISLLKDYVKTYCPEKYKEIFKASRDKLDNYTAYSGCIKQNGKTGVLLNKCTQEQFCAYLRKVLPKSDDEKYADMLRDIENGVFAPKQRTSENGVIPMQLHRAELVKILENAEGYLPFLSERDENGMTVSEKIIGIFNFRIPYYVGPLNLHSDKAWLVRTNEKIYPWNFERVVDVDKSAEEFINNLTSKCTYLPDKDVIPKNSLLYSAYNVLNELNNLKINGEKISVELKQSIYNNLFMKYRRVTLNALRKHLKENGYGDDMEITGIDNGFKSSLKPFIDFNENNITLPDSDKEEIIKAITIFGDDKKLLRKRLRSSFSDKLTDDEIVKISRLGYSGWSAFSKELLTDIYSVNKQTGEYINIINALWQTNDNFMMLIGSAYGFGEEIAKAASASGVKSLKEAVEELYVSPKVKRPIYQSLKIVEEIVKTQGSAPKKIFIEMARGEQAKKRTKSRKTRLLELYQSCGKEVEELLKQIENTPEDKFRQDKLYLYYTQFGKDMYTGKPISLETLFDNNVYDIDHIFPQSKIKDDSLDNRVLVNKADNASKSNAYPLAIEIRQKMYSFWKLLLDRELISKTKFERLTRSAPLTDAELNDFIARQLVETRQSTKAVASILSGIYGKDTEIVYVKAQNVSDFRRNYNMLKCREVNDLHHAKDAYLNIVVGNVYNEKYTHNKANFIRGLQTKQFSLNCMFNYDVKNAWNSDGSSLETVKKQMSKNNILYTRYSYVQSGGLFDVQPKKKGLGQVPLKQATPRNDISKYGGYNGPTAAYFAFVEYDGKKDKKTRALIAVDLYRVDKYEENPEKYMQEIMELKNARVLIKRVKYNSCLSINGCRMHISSKSNGGATIVYKPAVQLAIDYKYEDYIRDVSKFCQKGWDREYNKYDNLSADTNIELYDILCKKMTETVMKFNLGTIGEKIASSRDDFISLSVQKQCYTLLEILKIIHSNVMTGDLTFIGESKNAGKTTTNNKLSEIKNVQSIKLIHQSVTGLFENEVDLLK